MNVYELMDQAVKSGGEYVLGSQELKTHACYLVYGVLGQGEQGRVVKPGKGHEEIVCLVEGEVSLRGEGETFVLKQGEAFYLKGEETYYMDNRGTSTAVYVIAGGHSELHVH